MEANRESVQCALFDKLTNEGRWIEQKPSHYNLNPDNRFDSTLKQLYDFWFDL